MSKANAKTAEKKMSKDVQIVAYLAANPKAKKRGVMQTLHDSVDYADKSQKVRDYYRMVFAGGEERISEEQYDFLKDKDPAGIRLIHYQDVKDNYESNEYSFNNALRRRVLSDVDTAMPGSDMKDWLGRKVKLDDRTIFSVDASGPERMRMLRHQTEIDDGEMYEDDDTEYWTVTLRCKVNGLKPSLYRWFDDTVIPDLMREVSDNDWVWRTRVLDCEKEYSESGVCFAL